jgi:predicted RNase H-like nuclease
VATLHADGTTRVALRPTIDAVAALRGQAVVAIDVPIGLLESVELRACDLEARRRLGPRRASSVFAPPSRPMLAHAGDYAAIRALVARERQHRPAAKGLSAQAAGIAPKVGEVDAWVRAHTDSEAWLYECHPELSFLRLNRDTPLVADKRSPAGVVARLRLVRAAFPDAEDRIATAGLRGRDADLTDLLDAYAVLTTARRCARGQHELLGDGARDAAGLPMRMAV